MKELQISPSFEPVSVHRIVECVIFFRRLTHLPSRVKYFERRVRSITSIPPSKQRIRETAGNTLVPCHTATSVIDTRRTLLSSPMTLVISNFEAVLRRIRPRRYGARARCRSGFANDLASIENALSASENNEDTSRYL